MLYLNKQSRLITILMLCTLFFVQCKNKEIQTRKYSQIYRYQYSKSPVVDSVLFGLPMVNKVKYNKYIRVHLPSQIIELYGNDSGLFHGFLLNYILEGKFKRTDYETHKMHKYLFQKIEIDSIYCSKVANHLFSNGQYNIPTSYDIKYWNWKPKLPNSFSVQFQFKFGNNYKEQRYVYLSEQNDKIAYKSQILLNCDYISKELKLKEKLDSFIAKLPKGKHYFIYGLSESIQIPYMHTDKELKKIRKNLPHQKYMASIEDTLNKYLSDVLTKVLTGKNEINCPQIVLKFSISNKLKGVYSLYQAYGGKDEYDLEEKKEFKKCKQIIIKAFKDVRIDFVHSKKVYRKSLYYSFEEKKIIVY